MRKITITIKDDKFIVIEADDISVTIEYKEEYSLGDLLQIFLDTIKYME